MRSSCSHRNRRGAVIATLPFEVTPIEHGSRSVWALRDHLTEKVAGGVTSAATGCAAIEDSELFRAHTLADKRPQLFFFHKDPTR
jgi:hypothetical protein